MEESENLSKAISPRLGAYLPTFSGIQARHGLKAWSLYFCFFPQSCCFKSIFNSCKCTCFWLMECKLYWSQVVGCILFVLIYIIYWLNYIVDLLTFLLVSLVQAYNQSIYFAGWHLYLISYPFIFPLLTSEILERRPMFSLLSMGLYFLLSKVRNFFWICFIPLFFHLSYFALVCLYFLWVCFSFSSFSWLCFSYVTFWSIFHISLVRFKVYGAKMSPEILMRTWSCMGKVALQFSLSSDWEYPFKLHFYFE